MLTWLTMFFQKIEGSNLVLIIVGAMWLLYLGFFFVVKEKRGKQKISGTKTVPDITSYFPHRSKSTTICLISLHLFCR